VISAAVGAVAGDNIGYLVGRRFGPAVTSRFFSGGKARQRLSWARRQLGERGGQLILVGRFIPGRRTVVTLSAGMLHFPWGRFLAFDAAASLAWALYATLLGYFGRRAFENAAWKGLLLALGVGSRSPGSWRPSDGCCAAGLSGDHHVGIGLQHPAGTGGPGSRESRALLSRATGWTQ
jgi:uncharacterized membrane protein YdjX (TVP38/TMEM64 family)